jgi:cobalt-zinc-cadmium efflux system membrane fusion protein
MRTVFALIVGLVIGAGAAWLVLGRGHSHPPPPPPEKEMVQRTVWTDRHEIFIEHPPLVAGEPATFVTHVSELAEPRRTGAVTFELKRGAESKTLTAESPVRPGIYTPSLAFPQAGEWAVTLRIDEHRIDLGTFVVHARGEDAPPSEGPEGITFLKEQQWKLGTTTEPVGKRKLVQRLRVPGVVSHRPGSRAALTPPIEGRLLPAGRTLPAVGDRVEAGQVLALVQPPFSDFAAKLIEAEAETLRAQVAVEQADATVARLRKLVAENARPARELADAEFAQRTARANVEASKSLRAAYAKSGATLAPDGLPVFELRSPISGTVVRVAAAAGENVHTEIPVFTVLDPSRVWIEARVSEADLGRLGGSRAALFETPDAPGVLRPAGDAPAFIAPEVDPATRTVTLVYEAADLRIGTALTLHVETARAEEALAVPASAVVDEEGRFVAFVQLSGETFERRDIVLGIRDAGFVQVTSGLKEGERVVVKGAYAVRLASVSTSIPAHGHSH